MDSSQPSQDFLVSGPAINVIDATLREGLQAPGVVMDIPRSVEIARGLIALGVDAIECGHPAASPEENARVRAVVAAAGNTPVLAHARAHIADIDAVAETGAAAVGIFLGVSELSRECRVRRSLSELLDLVTTSVRHARGRGLQVRFTVEDSSRTGRKELMDAYSAAVAAGASRLCFADTVGQLTPADVREAIGSLRAAFPDVPIEAHFHDDRGFALANAFASLESGCTWISSSVNGLGERCGIVDTISLLVNLASDGHRAFPPTGRLEPLSRLVGAFSRSQVPRRAPMVGRDAFRHTAALHQTAVQRDARAYAWLDPAILGVRQNSSRERVPQDAGRLVVKPPVISSEELPYHRAGPGHRYVMIDERLVPDCRQYCIVRTVPPGVDRSDGHVDPHRHDCDSLFLFLGTNPDLRGFRVEVQIGDERVQVDSPASVFIPAGVVHSYRVLSGPGLFVNHVLAGLYQSSLLPDAPECAATPFPVKHHG